MSYKSEVEAKQQELNTANEATRQQEAFYEFYQRNRDQGLIACQANTAILRDWLAGVTITAQSLQDAYDHTSVRQQLAHTRGEASERLDLVNFIIENRKMQPQTEEAEKSRLLNPRLTSIETVRTIADRVKNRRELESKSVEEIREIVRAGQPHNGLQEIPQEYRSKSALLHLAKTNLTVFKRLMQQCGRAALDAIIQRSE